MVDHLFGYSPLSSLAWKRQEEYEVRIFDDLVELEAQLKLHTRKGLTARLVAGFCWEWSDPRPDGGLVKDVKIGGWARPWNRKPRDMWKNKGTPEPPGRHPYTIWATRPEGFGQVGCIYSAQGFEFDYVAVIFGSDLKWNPGTNAWLADLQHNKDRVFHRGVRHDHALALEKLKNVYRVLCTRGMKGTYFYFLDAATRQYFERMSPDHYGPA